MASSSRSGYNPAQNFRPGYNVNPTQAQKVSYQQHQQAYEQMPADTYENLRRLGEAVDERRREYEARKAERESVARRTQQARNERRDRNDPDMQDCEYLILTFLSNFFPNPFCLRALLEVISFPKRRSQSH